MRLHSFLTLAAAGAAFLPAGAQRPAPDVRMRTLVAGAADHRAALGITTAASGTARDTLGLLVTAVTPGSPAERAGVVEGNRIVAVNGASLRANAADLQDDALAGVPSRRLVRELAKVKAGDEVSLQLWRDGRTSALKVRTADADSLFGRARVARMSRSEIEGRAVLGFGLGASGTRRDTLGVLVMSVPDSTPAARAGLEEGNRIAAIDGVDLRVAREDAGDPYMGRVQAQRLQREIGRRAPGSDVTLRVYADGRYREVKAKLARASELPRSASGMTRPGDDAWGMMAPVAPMMPMMPPRPMPATPPVPPREGAAPREANAGEPTLDVERVMLRVRRELELLGPEMESMRPALDRLRPELERLRIELPEAMRRARREAMSVRTV